MNVLLGGFMFALPSAAWHGRRDLTIPIIFHSDGATVFEGVGYIVYHWMSQLAHGTVAQRHALEYKTKHVNTHMQQSE